MPSYPIEAVISAKEKRYEPVKHYVFIVQVRWSDGSKIPIYRQYSDFAQLHTALVEVAATILEEHDLKIILPVFPVKKLFQRSEVSKTASKRGSAFDEYCQNILKLDKKISQNKVVVDFFKARYDDINPPDTKPPPKRTSLLQALSLLLPGGRRSTEVQHINIKQSRSSEALNLTDEDDPIYVSSPIVCETYIVQADYIPQEKSEIKLKEGMSVEVVEKYDNGWWFVQTEYGFGWAAATYLKPLEPEEEEPEPIYSGERFITTEDYTAELDDEVTFTKGVLVKVLHKLLDGWWIIDYQGQVGYVPATYLTPLKNPHYRDSKYGLKRGGRPTKRRSTIKNAAGRLLRDVKKRDLSIYKKLSEKLNKQEAQVIARRLERKEKDNEKKSVRIKLPEEKLEGREDTNTRVSRSLRIPSEVQEYEYIDEEDMEEINEWVDQNIYKNDSSISSQPGNTSLSEQSSILKENSVILPEMNFQKAPPPPTGAKYGRHPSLPDIKLPEGMSFQRPPSDMALRRLSSAAVLSNDIEPAPPGMIYAKPPVYSTVNKSRRSTKETCNDIKQLDKELEIKSEDKIVEDNNDSDASF